MPNSCRASTSGSPWVAASPPSSSRSTISRPANGTPDAVGPTKRGLADVLIRRLRDCCAPAGLLHYGPWRQVAYPGETLPRWTFSALLARRRQADLEQTSTPIAAGNAVQTTAKRRRRHAQDLPATEMASGSRPRQRHHRRHGRSGRPGRVAGEGGEAPRQCRSGQSGARRSSRRAPCMAKVFENGAATHATSYVAAGSSAWNALPSQSHLGHGEVARPRRAAAVLSPPAIRRPATGPAAVVRCGRNIARPPIPSVVARIDPLAPRGVLPDPRQHCWRGRRAGSRAPSAPMPTGLLHRSDTDTTSRPAPSRKSPKSRARSALPSPSKSATATSASSCRRWKSSRTISS